MSQLFLPDLLFADGRPHQGAGLLVGADGMVLGVVKPESLPGVQVIPLIGKALLPGLANAHSHTFQRLFRTRAEGRVSGGDTFWTWREQMYRAACFVSPGDVYDVARATFLEMLAAGITVVGEFHYLHNDTDGRPYADPNALAHEVIRAAQSAGIRLCLMRAAYLRAGFQRPPHAGQRRFYEASDDYLRNLEALLKENTDTPNITVGAAPHSIRAVPLNVLEEIATFARAKELQLHMHISEQTAENGACVAEYGQTPIALIADRGILTPQTTLVHAIHLTDVEFEQVAAAGSTICSCPTTERNLGDGVFPADVAARLNIRVCFGTDSQAQIDILEDARQSEYHLRLVKQERGILDQIRGEEISARLLRSATSSGYSALGLAGGNLAPGEPADFFTADLSDVALLGTDKDSLATQAVFALCRSAIRDVAVAGRIIIQDGRHPLAEEIASRYCQVQKRFIAQEGQ